MRRIYRGALVAIVALGALVSISPAAFANARLGTSAVNPVANGSTAYFRSAGDAKLVFPNGTDIKCRHAYASLGNATINNNTITGTSTAGTWTNVATINSLIFGDLMPITQTTSSGCPSTINGFPTCTFTVNTPLQIDAQINSGANPDQGINVRVYKSLGPPFVSVRATGVCTSTGGGTITCVYDAGIPNTPGFVNGSSPYSAGVASTLTFTDQPFYKVSGPAQCPVTPAASGSNPAFPAKFSASYNLYTAQSGGSQISAYKQSEKP